VSDGSQQDAFYSHRCLREIGNRLQIFPPYFLTYENEMDSAASFRLFRIHKHVNARDMTIPKTERFHGSCDALKILPINGHIDISCESGSIVVALADLEKNGHSPNDAVLDSSFRQRRMKASQNIEKLFHVSIYSRRGNHSTRCFDFDISASRTAFTVLQ